MGKAKRKATRTRRATDREGTATGRALLAGLEQVVSAMEAGGMAEVERRFTVHRVPVRAFTRPTFAPADVVAVRAAVGASQAVFAAMLGVSANTVRAWEQGVNPPSGMAARFLDEVRRDPAYWTTRVQAAAAG